MSNNSGFVGSGVCGVKQTPDYKEEDLGSSMSGADGGMNPNGSPTGRVTKQSPDKHGEAKG